jgi:GT2 family glycosyltransferase
MIMEPPEISIVGTAARPNNWLELYSSLGNNDVSFEIVFVGPNPPTFGLPDNFKFIQSNVKPAQCIEIAIRNAKARLFMIMSDDVFFTSVKPLDYLYQAYQLYDDEKLILSPKFMRSGKDLSITQTFWGDDRESPLLSVGGLMSKKIFFNLGGFDKNFIAIMADVDYMMRIWETGGQVILADIYLEENKSKSNGSRLCSDYWEHDRQLLLNLWSKNNTLLKNRAAPVESFNNVKLMAKSQGPKGRWKYDSSLYNKVITHPLYYKAKFLKSLSLTQLILKIYRRII